MTRAAAISQHAKRKLASLAPVLHDGFRWADRTAHRDQQAAAFDAADNSQHSTACILDSSDVSVKILRRSECIEDICPSQNFRISHCKPRHKFAPQLARGAHSTSACDVSASGICIDLHKFDSVPQKSSVDDLYSCFVLGTAQIAFNLPANETRGATTDHANQHNASFRPVIATLPVGMRA